MCYIYYSLTFKSHESYFSSTLADTRADKTLVGYLETLPGSSWLESCYEAEGPFYQCTMSLLLHTPARWKTYRIAHLNRLIVLAHQRYVSPSSPTKTIVDVTVKHYAVYKSALIFFGLVDCIYANFFKVHSSSLFSLHLLIDYIKF